MDLILNNYFFQCSKTCGIGHHYRRIDCRLKKATNISLTFDSQPTVPTRMCMTLTRPNVSKECVMNPCDADYRWSIGPWSAVSDQLSTFDLI